ncbi:MAG: protein phosphatase CheZ [Nitrospirae bacterium]|nr:protein phosphatase CheZ [Nitrospirota bacterium]
MQQYIGFNLNRNEYMLPILKVREIITMPSITILPQLPSYIQGITNLRGAVIPIVNLKSLLSSEDDGETGRTVIVVTAGQITFGIIVDGITGVVKVDEANIEPPDKIISINADLLEGVAKLDNRLIVLLNTKKILPLDDMSLLEETIVNVNAAGNGDTVEVVREIDTIGGKVTVKELRNAKDFFNSKSETTEAKHAIFELMLGFMDAIASGDHQRMDEITSQLVRATDSDLFKEVGKITRRLHDSLEEFKLSVNSGLQRITENDVPNAVDNLQFVIRKTEEAANKTMGIVERYFEESNELLKHLDKIKGHNDSVDYLRTFKDSLDNDMTMILTAQQFQDITGQTIKKVIDLVNNVEVELLRLITKFGVLIKAETEKAAVAAGLEPGAVAEAEKTTVKVTQSDVESLLNEFGF